MEINAETFVYTLMDITGLQADAPSVWKTVCEYTEQSFKWIDFRKKYFFSNGRENGLIGNPAISHVLSYSNAVSRFR